MSLEAWQPAGRSEWGPLERFAAVTWRLHEGALRPGDFMYMGPADGIEPPIDRYKHIRTRRYINLDAAGHAHRYVGGGDSSGEGSPYARWCGPLAAIEHLELPSPSSCPLNVD